ncbi:MAG: methylmalonyl-CoA mutase [Candidatus Schekmanbacteria bacterium]|nr:MAG: methylmalonyl-CoA mutase [Candidatus Schekmanbacteria bacterium]
MSERKKNFFTPSNIEIRRYYPIKDKSGKSYLEKEGLPGEYPFTRGIQKTMYRGKIWTMRQYAGFGTASDTNERFKMLIKQGQKGLSVAFDLPTQMGLDSDSPRAEGEVGKIGVAVDTLSDMEEIFDGIEIDKISVSMTANAQAAVMLAMYIAVAKKRGIPLHKLRGTLQNDIIKEYVSRGTYIYSPMGAMRLASDIIEFCSLNLPQWNPISISGYHYREAGCNAIQEIAFMFSAAIAYIDDVLQRSISIDSFAPKISWIMSAGMNIFEETAKFRAARRIWSKLVKERFNAKNESSMKFRVFAATMGSTFTLNEPMNNIVRGTIEALSAVLGGVQSLHISSYDEALGIPSEESARVSLRIQQILAYESGLCGIIDSFGGSSYLEELTDKIEEDSVQLLKEIEERGGAIWALEKNFFQQIINREAWKEKRDIESKIKKIVGLNCFVSKKDKKIKAFKISEEVEKEQRAKLAKVKRERNDIEVKKSLDNLVKSAKVNNINLMPAIIECVESYATVEEICSSLKNVFGTYSPSPSF